MDSDATLNSIPYFEYKVINDLVHSHMKEFKSNLRAVIAFGALKTTGETYDIELLEVVDVWEGQAQFQSGSSASLPMRGKLYLDFLPSAEFERVAEGDETEETRRLIRRVLGGYEIVYETPAGYAREILRQARESRPGREVLQDPLRPRAKAAGKV